MARRQEPGSADTSDPTNAPTYAPKSTQPHQNSGGSAQNATDRIFQSSERGKPLPLCYGTARVGPNIIERYDSIAATNTLPLWMPNTAYLQGDFRLSTGRSYVCITAGTSSTVGTMGDGPSGTGTDIIDGDVGAGTEVHWKYIASGVYTAMVLGYCEGQVYGTGRVWQDSRAFADISNLVVVSANYQLFLGTPTGVTRPAWFPFTSDPLPDYYSNTVVLFINGSSGADATVPNVSLEVKGIFADATHVDASPADIALDMLTHPRRGIYWPSARVDSVSTGTGASSWRTYCMAYGLNLSWVIDTQTDVLTLLGLLLDATNSDAIQTNRPDGLGFMLRFVPRGDQALTANGVTFTPNTTATAIGPDDLIEPIAIQRSPPIDRFNSCPIEYVNRAGDYVRDAVDDPDMADVELRGLRRATTFALPQVLAPEAAIMLSRIRAQRSLNVTRTFTLKLPDRFLLLEPTDLLTVSDPVMGLVNVPMRVTAVAEDQANDGSITITAEDWPGLVHAAAAYTPQPGDGMKPNYGTALARLQILPSQVPPRTLPDSTTTRGGSVDNIFPNHNSEKSPPDGTDTTTAEWAGILDIGSAAFAGSKVRQLSVAATNAHQNLGDASRFVEGGATYPAAGFNRPATQECQLAFIIPCSPGESFYIEAQTRFTVGANGANAGVFIYFLDAANKGTAQPTIAVTNATCGLSVPTPYTKTTASGTAPAGATQVYFFCFAGSNLGAVTAQFDAIYARRQVDPALMVGPVFSAPTLANWTAGSGLAYWKDAVNIVHIKGTVSPQIGYAVTAFVLPAGYRPAFDRYFVVADTNQVAAFFKIDTAGNVVSFGMTVGHIYDITAISFLAEA